MITKTTLKHVDIEPYHRIQGFSSNIFFFFHGVEFEVLRFTARMFTYF